MRLVSSWLAVAAAILPSTAHAQPTFDLTYDGTAWRVERPSGPITSRDPVSIRIRRFNFLRYTLRVDLTDEQPEAFEYLARLWVSVLNPAAGEVLGALGGEASAVAAPDPLLTAARRVYADAQELQRRIDAALAPHTRPGLTTEEADALAAGAARVREADGELRRSYLALQRLVEGDEALFRQAFGGSTKAYFKLAADSYEDVIARSDSFQSLARRTVDGEVRQLGTRDPGTRVTATITATDPSGARIPIQTIHYVARGRMPLAAHGGLAFSGVTDAPRAFTAFVGWQAWAAGAAPDTETKQEFASVLLSIGTDLEKPGRRVYAGPSLMLVGRFIVTAGAAFTTSSTAATWFAAMSVRLY